MSKSGTRRPNGDGMLRKRSDGTWEARYIVKYDETTGKPIRKSIYGSGQNEVRQRLKDILADLDSGTYVEQTGLKLKDWLPYWLRVYKWEVPKPIAPTTRDSYMNSMDKHIIPRFGEKTLDGLTSDELQEWLNSIAKTKRRTAELALIVLNTSYKQAIKTKKVKWNPCDAVSLGDAVDVDPDKEDEKALTEEEFSALWSAILDSKHKAPMLILITGGLRIGEMCSLAEDDVAFGENFVRVRKNTVRVKNDDPTVSGKTKRIVQNKTKTSAGRRVVPLPLITMNAIAEHLEAQKAFMEKHGLINPEGYLFPGRDYNGPIDKDAFRRREFANIITASGVKRNVTPHMLRHTYNSLLHEAEIDPERRQELLGHADAKSNAIYTHIKLKAKQEAVERFSELTDGILKRNKEHEKMRAAGDNVVAFKQRK